MAAVAGMPPNSGAREVGQALTEQLAVGVVPLSDAHPVGDGRRQQALQRGQRRDGDRRQEQGVEVAERDDRAGTGAGRPAGIRPMVAAPRSSAGLAAVAATTAISEPGSPGRSRARSQDAAATTATAMATGAQTGVGDPRLDGRHGQHEDLLGVDVDAEGGRELLERDDRRDADGEALDDRDRARSG